MGSKSQSGGYDAGSDDDDDDVLVVSNWLKSWYQTAAETIPSLGPLETTPCTCLIRHTALHYTKLTSIIRCKISTLYYVQVSLRDSNEQRVTPVRI